MVQSAGPKPGQDVSDNKKFLTAEQNMSFKFILSQIHIHFVEAVLGSDHQLLLALKNGLAKSVSLEEKTVKFDEVGILVFRERIPCILKEQVLKELFWKSCAHFAKVLLEYTKTFSTHHMN